MLYFKTSDTIIGVYDVITAKNLFKTNLYMHIISYDVELKMGIMACLLSQHVGGSKRPAGC